MFRSLFRSRSKAVNLLHRVVPAKRCQDRSYTGASGHRCHRVKHRDLVEEENPSSHFSPLVFAIPPVVLGVVGLAAYVRFNDDRRAIPRGKGPCEACPAKGPTIGGPFTLINTKRETITEQNLLGNWSLLYFGYTSSPDVGPAELQKMAKAIDALESKQNVKVVPVFVTIDPQRDSPSQLDSYLKEFYSKTVGLTGPDSCVRKMAQQYRVFFKKVEEDGNDYLIDSSHMMFLMNPSMEMVRCFGTEYSDVDLVEEISKEVKKTVT